MQFQSQIYPLNYLVYFHFSNMLDYVFLKRKQLVGEKKASFSYIQFTTPAFWMVMLYSVLEA
ncbi:hypothetical protein DN604_23305 [Aeromonas caviae]|nr:hypothetical protein DN604_23305 [Aeromonas caviae]